MRVGTPLVACIAVLLGCSRQPSSTPAPIGDASVDAPAGDCPPGLRPAPDGQGCIDLSAPDPCPAGTGPFLGSATCQPVGWIGACPTGMKADPSGWGCIDVSPPAPCSDPTTMEMLGSTVCVPVGDCSAPFPPAGATIFVNASYAASQLDAKHFQSVFPAVQSAPANAVIAVESGTYVEDVDIHLPVTIVGRCAAKVIIVNPGDDRAGMLVDGPGAKGVTLRGLTLTGQNSAVYAQMGGTVTVEESILSANRSMGIYVTDPGSQATVNGVRITGTVPPSSGVGAGMYGWGIAVQAGGSVVVTNSAIVGNTEYGIVLGGSGISATVDSTLVAWQKENAGGMYGEGIVVGGGASLTLRGSAVVGNHSTAIDTQDPGSNATISESVLRGTLLDAAGTNGGGIFVESGSSARLTSSAIAETEWDGITVAGSGSSATVESVVVRGPLPKRGGTWGYGANVADGGHLAIDGSAIVGASLIGLNVEDASSVLTSHGTLIADTVPVMSAMYPGGGGMGVVAQAGGHVTLAGCSVIGNTTVGLFAAAPGAAKADLNATGTLIRGTSADSNQNYGFGALVEDMNTLELSGCAVVGNTVVGVALTNGVASISGSVIRTVAKGSTGNFGHGLVAVLGGRATLNASYVRENPGIGLAFSASDGAVTSSWVAVNTIGIQALDGSMLTESDSTSPLATDEVRVSSDTQFTGNGSRVGSGEVPLPVVSLGSGHR